MDEWVNDDEITGLDDSYLWETRLIDPKDLEYTFPKPTLSFVIFRNNNCKETIEALYNELDNLLKILRHHYPFRCDLPQIEIKKHKYKKSSKKKEMISYIYGQLTYDDSTIDENIMHDLIFKFCSNHLVFAKVFNSESFESLLVKYYDEGLNDDLLDSMKSINRVWIVGDKIVTIKDSEEDEEDKHADILPLATAIGYMKKGEFTSDHILETNDILSRKKFETSPFDDLQYVIDVDTVMDDPGVPLFNMSPYMIPTAITKFINKGFTLKDAVQFDPAERKPKPFKFSIGYLSYCELLALHTKRQQELKNEGKDPNSITFEIAVYQIISTGMVYVAGQDPDKITESNKDNAAYTHIFNTRNHLQDKLIQKGYLNKRIPPTEDFLKESFKNPISIDRQVEEVQQKVHTSIEEMLAKLTLGEMNQHDLPINLEDIFLGTDDLLFPHSSDDEEDVWFADPTMAEEFGKLSAELQNEFREDVRDQKEEEYKYDPDDPFGLKKEARKRKEQLQELKELHKPKDSDDEAVYNIMSRLVRDRRGIDDRYSQRISDEYIYFNDMNELYSQGITPREDDFYLYYHPEDPKYQYYYDPYIKTAEEISSEYKDVTEYTSDEEDDLYRQCHTLEDYNDSEIKYIKLKRKIHSELRTILGQGKDDNSDNDYNDADEEEDDDDVEDRIIDVDNEEDAEVYRDIDNEKKEANKFLIEEI
ncbi:hypothetical protein DFJ63DRAFT_18842 [Scheffersomyces coipomensis]|uniref:uncharacterized protein n=1 Tax=Scheffersomyces coipomensis TaxID=1788519 RepID=UPI00315DD35B